jgi:hypothetical protein
MNAGQAQVAERGVGLAMIGERPGRRRGGERCVRCVASVFGREAKRCFRARGLPVVRSVGDDPEREALDFDFERFDRQIDRRQLVVAVLAGQLDLREIGPSRFDRVEARWHRNARACDSCAVALLEEEEQVRQIRRRAEGRAACAAVAPVERTEHAGQLGELRERVVFARDRERPSSKRLRSIRVDGDRGRGRATGFAKDRPSHRGVDSPGVHLREETALSCADDLRCRVEPAPAERANVVHAVDRRDDRKQSLHRGRFALDRLGVADARQVEALLAHVSRETVAGEVELRRRVEKRSHPALVALRVVRHPSAQHRGRKRVLDDGGHAVGVVLSAFAQRASVDRRRGLDLVAVEPGVPIDGGAIGDVREGRARQLKLEGDRLRRL